MKPYLWVIVVMAGTGLMVPAAIGQEPKQDSTAGCPHCATQPVQHDGQRGTGHGKCHGQHNGGDHGKKHGKRHRQAGRGKHAKDSRHEQDRAIFHELLAHHGEITRTVTEIPGGVETLTESNDPRIAKQIREHVYWMKQRMKAGNPIRRRDPLFAELFRHADEITFEYSETDGGVRATETSADPYVTKLIRAHARAVSGFVADGFAAARENHDLPGKPAATRAEGCGENCKEPSTKKGQHEDCDCRGGGRGCVCRGQGETAE